MDEFTSGDSHQDAFSAIQDPTRRLGATAWTMLNMVSSLDGATAIDGVSSALGGHGDREMFTAIRDLCDVIIVGSATAKAENYRPPYPSPTRQERRIRAGAIEKPMLAIISRSLNLSNSLEIFSASSQRPIILTSKTADPQKKARLSEVADLIEVGEEAVDPKQAVAALLSRGLKVQLLEGGPTVNGQFVQAGLLNEMFLTISPKLVGGSSSRIAVGAGTAATEMELISVLRQDDELFLRYLRKDLTD